MGGWVGGWMGQLPGVQGSLFNRTTSPARTLSPEIWGSGEWGCPYLPLVSLYRGNVHQTP